MERIGGEKESTEERRRRGDGTAVYHVCLLWEGQDSCLCVTWFFFCVTFLFLTVLVVSPASSFLT